MKFDYARYSCRPARAVAKEWREKMVEVAAEANEDLMNKYLEEGDLSEDEIKQACVTRTIASEIVPMLCGSAFKNKGVQAMLGCGDRIHASAHRHSTSRRADDGRWRNGCAQGEDDEKFSALAFKIMTDPFVGQLIFFRVYSGT